MSNPDIENIVIPFYALALTVNTKTTPAAVLERVLADGFVSINSQESKNKPTLIAQLGHFWRLIPNLVWEPQDIVVGVNGKKVVVRSVATGTPKGSFMGLELDGSRSFKIDTIDIHEVAGGQIVRVHHLEDWATALKQLKA